MGWRDAFARQLAAIPRKNVLPIVLLVIIFLYLVPYISLMMYLRVDQPRCAELAQAREATARPHLVLTSLYLDRYNSMETLRKAMSQLLLLAIRTNRVLVIPHAIDGKVISPAIRGASITRPGDSIHRVIPDYFELSQSAKIAGLQSWLITWGQYIDRIGPGPHSVVAVTLHCSSHLCGPSYENLPCGPSVPSAQDEAVRGWATISSRRCISIADYDSTPVQAILTHDFPENDVVFDNYHTNLFPESASISTSNSFSPIPLALVLVPSSQVERFAEKFVAEHLGTHFYALYMPFNWTTASSAKAAFQQLRTHVSIDPGRHILVLTCATRARGAEAKSEKPYGASNEAWSVYQQEVSGPSDLLFSHGISGASDWGFLALAHEMIVLHSKCIKFLSTNHQEPWSSTIFARRKLNREQHDPEVASPSESWPSSKQSDVAFFIPTVYFLHATKVKTLLDTWLRGYEKHVYFLSDTTFDRLESGIRIPNVIDTGCKNNKLDGLWCRNDFMFKYISRNHKKFENYKWFARFDDEALLLLPNLFDYLKTQQTSRKMLIGEVYCHNNFFKFASGGPGYVFSRAFIDSFDFSLWRRTPLEHLPFWTDDIVTGFLCNKTADCELRHHPGFSYSPAGVSWNQVYQWYLSKNSTWDLPFRPLAFHQRGNTWNLAPQAWAELSSIVYSPAANLTVIPTHCYCFRDYFSRCSISRELAESGNCRYHSVHPSCVTGH